MGEDLIGRTVEGARLRAALASAADGRGSLILLSGEAGAGKTRLAEAVLGGTSSATFVRGTATPGCAPFAPVTTAIRGYLRIAPDGLRSCGPLRANLALLLPELGEGRETADRGTLFEAIRCGLIAMAAARPVAILLDDLQWSDDATLEFLAGLAPTLRDAPVLIVAAHRSGELPRSHPLRRLRHDLRRERALHEIALEPLAPADTAALVAQVLGAAPSERLAARASRPHRRRPVLRRGADRGAPDRKAPPRGAGRNRAGPRCGGAAAPDRPRRGARSPDGAVGGRACRRRGRRGRGTGR